MLRKTKMMAAVLGIVAIGCVSCKQDSDVMSIFEDLANKNINGDFSYWAVDTANMKTTLYQYTLNRTDLTGTYRVASVGNAVAFQPTSEDFTFVNQGFVEQNLFTQLALTMSNGDQKMVRWGNASIYDGDMVLPTSNDFNTMLTGIVPLVGNQDVWVRSDTSKFVTVDTVTTDYMYWTGTKKQYNLTPDSVAKLEAFFAQQWVKDTIKWFNEEYGKRIADTIRYIAKDESYVVPAYDIRQREAYITHFVGYESIYTYKLFINRDGSNVNTGYLLIDTLTNTRDVYDNPMAETAKSYESHIKLENAAWFIPKVSYAKGFDLILRGKYAWSYVEKVKGEETASDKKEEANVLKCATITDYVYDKQAHTGTMTYDGIKLTLTQN